MKKILAGILVLLNFSYLFSQTVISYNGNSNYVLTERTDLRRYDNGKYKGLVSREVKSFISPQSNEDGFLYDGNFFVEEKTLRALQDVAAGVSEAIPSVFKISDTGILTMLEDNGYPSFRSFPTFSKDEVYPGVVWEGKAERAVDPLNKGVVTRMPMYVQYTYVKDEVYNGQEVYLLKAQWATRYGTNTRYIDPDGDKELKTASGSHSANIYISKLTGCALVVRDTVNEYFVYTDGNKIEFKGTISLFTEYPPSVNEEEIIPVIEQITQEDDIEYEKTNAGYKLTMLDLKFKPDSPELLPGEEARLDKIAELLKKTGNTKLLVEGHTARTGTIDNEMELSLQRAHSIVNSLVQRGVKAERFICKGSGGTKPIADNSTPEGRARNRRVEITILTDK